MEEETLYNDVEDIMCDQGIISEELTVMNLESRSCVIISIT